VRFWACTVSLYLRKPLSRLPRSGRQPSIDLKRCIIRRFHSLEYDSQPRPQDLAAALGDIEAHQDVARTASKMYAETSAALSAARAELAANIAAAEATTEALYVERDALASQLRKVRGGALIQTNGVSTHTFQHRQRRSCR
jgi:hypothetical protein